jgi:hypothetical protein
MRGSVLFGGIVRKDLQNIIQVPVDPPGTSPWNLPLPEIERKRIVTAFPGCNTEEVQNET